MLVKLTLGGCFEWVKHDDDCDDDGIFRKHKILTEDDSASFSSIDL